MPRVIEHGGDADAEWLVTEALRGESAVAPRWVADPATAVRAVGEGLRALHDALPVEDCPFVWDVPSRLANAAARGIHLPARFADPPPVDRAVVCHADACCPNTLIGDDGRWSAHVDLGQLGVGDRWADIAVASMSTEWNYGPGWEDALIAAYGVEPDRERLAFYRDLWNARPDRARLSCALASMRAAEVSDRDVRHVGRVRSEMFPCTEIPAGPH